MGSVKPQVDEKFFRNEKINNDFFNVIFNKSDLGIVLTDTHGNVLKANPQFLSLNLPDQNKINFQALLSRKAQSETEEYFHDTGEELLKIILFKLSGETEERPYLWLISHDAASTVHGNMSLLKNLYRSFIDTTFELVFRTTPSGQIIFANHLFLQNFGFPCYKLAKGSNIEPLFEDQAHFQLVKEKLEQQKKIVSETILFKRTDGKRLTGLVNCRIYTDTNGAPQWNWAVLNISQQAESEKALKAKNDELAKVNHQMEKFLYSTSHDLRSPLTSILGLVNLMRMETKDSTILDYISKIESSTLKLDKIIRDIMSFSRTTYQRMNSEKIDFETVIWKSINNYRTDPSLRKINFEVKAQGGFPFFNDPERIDIIIDNIIRNSICFYDVNKARPFIRVNVIAEKDKALLEFMDNGIGIGHQHLENIFNMFYKASHHSKGAGLGLFIVKETLEKLQGTVTVESEIGFGTLMRIKIPNDHKGRLISRKLELQNNM